MISLIGQSWKLPFRRSWPAALVLPRQIVGLAAVLIVGWIPVLITAGAVAAASDLFALAQSPNPYWAPAHAGLLYLWSPIVVMSACVFLLTPGLLLSLALGAARSPGQWVLTGLALSLGVNSVAAALVQGLIGKPLVAGPFAMVVAACAAVSFGMVISRLTRTGALIWPLDVPNGRFSLATMTVAPLILLVALTPKFYWESFNGDGAHAYESARLLLFQALPFWPTAAGEIADFPGTTSMLFAFPSSWFIRLFGEHEAAARLPLLLYLVALYGALIALVEHRRGAALGRAEHLLIWLVVAIFTVVMAFSATYTPYSADIALPATQDTLLVVSFLGFVLSFVRREAGWTYFFAALTYVSLPNGSLLIGFFLVAVLLVWRPIPWAQVKQVGACLVVCAVAAALLPAVLGFLNQPLPGNEYGSLGILRRFAFLQWSDWHRLAFLIVPSGILPALSLMAWRWQDPLARALTLVTVAYFVFFYVQAHIVLHHFVPVMLLPLVVFWRSELLVTARRRPSLIAATAVAGLAALFISLPRDPTPYVTARTVGTSIEDRLTGYDTMDPGAFRRFELLASVFPYDWDPSMPQESYGGSPLPWSFYAHRAARTESDVNYLLQPAAAGIPDGMRQVAADDGVALLVKSESVLASHRGARPSTLTRSDVYALPRGIIFRSVPLTDGPPILDVVATLEGFGLDPNPLLARLGVQR